MKQVFTLLLTLLLVGALHAQNHNHRGEEYVRCYTTEAEAERRAKNPNMPSKAEFEDWISKESAKLSKASNRRATVLTIPIIFHIIHNGEAVGTAPNIDAIYVNAQIEQLNNDYRRILGTSGHNTNPVGADIEIEFCPALLDESDNLLAEPGINRVDWTAQNGPYTSTYFDNSIKCATQWDPNLYMNFWSADLSGGLLGWAQFPEAATLGGIGTGNGSACTDGVVHLYSSIGSTTTPYPGGAPYNEGRTATHEIGHWLGLRHIWGDGACGTDDFCADTPESDASNGGCPTGHVSCGTVDMIENYMDYTNDACMNIFTQDQKTRMRIVMGDTGNGSVRRAILASSPKCQIPTGFTINQTNSPVSVCQPNDAVFNLDLVYNGAFSGNVNMSASGNPAGTSVSFSSNPVGSAGAFTMTVSGTGAATPGSYTITVSGVSGADSDTEDVVLNIDGAVSGTPTLTAPANGATNVTSPVNLTWSAAAGASSYQVQIATDAGFTSIVSDQTGITGTSYAASGLSTTTQYYWRVRGVSGCGDGTWSSVFNFTTADISPCLQYAAGPYIDFGSAACFPDCQTPIAQTFEVYANESYIVEGLTVGAEYTFEFCSGYSAATWDANITVAGWDGANPTANIFTVNGCNATFTTTSADIIVIIWTTCGGAEVQTNNGIPTFQCTGNGGTLPTACPDCPLSENFEAGQPAGWNFSNTGSGSWSFDANPFGGGTYTNPGSGNWAYFDDDAAGNGSVDVATATSPVLDLSASASPTIAFDYNNQAYNTSGQAFLSVTDGSLTYYWNGTAWGTGNTPFEINDNPTGAVSTTALPSALCLNTITVAIVWDDEADWGWGFGFDNFQICSADCPIPTAIPTDASTTTYTADRECTDAMGWTHYIDDAGTPADTADDLLLLSVKKNGNCIGNVGDGTFAMTMVANPTASTITAPYVTNSAWYTMNRHWEITPNPEPTSDVDVRFYFTQADVDALNTQSGGLVTNPGDMFFWKINDVTSAGSYDIDPANGHAGVPLASAHAADGYQQYANSGAASSTTWLWSPNWAGDANWNYGEYTVGHFGGGGGGIGPDATGALPVELSGFTATPNRTTIDLSWVTNSERNNKGFEVQRSIDARGGFAAIGWVDGLGNTSDEQNYAFEDATVRKGITYYYQLKQIDFDGSFEYSDIVSAQIAGKGIGVNMLPNPAKNAVAVILSGDLSSDLALTILDIQGRVIENLPVAKDATRIDLDITDYPAGVYLVKISSPTETVVTKLIVE